MQQLLSVNPRGKNITDCPLFKDVKLGGVEGKELTTADGMADLMEALSKL